MSDYERTPEQLAVISHPLSPLRVAAGAGTGKTATVTDRLARIVDEGIAPEAALGITFTNKAAEELSERLRSRLASHAEQGREVTVTTYHGFAYTLLQDFGAFVGIERDTEVIGPGYVRQLMFEALEGLSFDVLDLAAPAHRVAEAVTLAGQLGDNLLGAEHLLVDGPGRKEDPWPARRELAAVVARYEQLKRELGVVDYPDLIRYAHALVTNRPEIAQRLRDRYDVVVLDEYQDTAPAQRELLRTIFGRGFPLTAVGDSDQTIYEWRGASQENFDGFTSHFSAGDGRAAESLVLSTNFRSGSTILDVAHSVRSRIYAGEEFVRLQPATEADEGVVETRWFRTAVDEAMWIADEMVRLHRENDVPWAEMAVLFRKNRQISLVRDACAAAGVPVEVASLGGLLDVPEVADLVAWLRLLHHRDDTVSLARILLGSRYRLGLGDLAALSSWATKLGLRGDEEGPAWPLLEAIDHAADVETLPDEAAARLVEFASLYRTLLTTAQSTSLVELCRTVLDAVGAWDEVQAMESSAATSTRLNLYRFLDLAQQWSPLRGRPSLDAFLGYLELLEEEQTAEELDTARLGGAEAAALLTVHRAKGLEWHAVFLPALVDGTFPARSLGHDNPVDYAKFVPFELRLDSSVLPDLAGTKKQRTAALRTRHLAGEWRVAYVAVTRARHRLYLSGAFWYDGATPREPSDLYRLAAEVPGVTRALRTEDPGEPPLRLAIGDGAPPPDPLFADGWRAALRAEIESPGTVQGLVSDAETFQDEVRQLRLLVDGLPADRIDADDAPPPSLSVTGLVTLATCPRQFFWTDIEPLPRRPTAAQQRGIEVHRRIELHHRGSISFDDLSHDLYDVTDEPAEAADGSRHDPFANFLASPFADRRPLFIETPIDLKVGETRVRGRIDAVYETDDGGWQIVDYKSGRARASDEALVQLQAYAVAARDGAVASDPPDDLAVSFVYLGGDRAVEITLRADDDWLDAAYERVARLAELARGDRFDPTPGSACHHCDFVKFCEPGRDYLAAD